MVVFSEKGSYEEEFSSVGFWLLDDGRRKRGSSGYCLIEGEGGEKGSSSLGVHRWTGVVLVAVGVTSLGW